MGTSVCELNEHIVYGQKIGLPLRGDVRSGDVRSCAGRAKQSDAREGRDGEERKTRICAPDILVDLARQVAQFAEWRRRI